MVNYCVIIFYFSGVICTLIHHLTKIGVGYTYTLLTINGGGETSVKHIFKSVVTLFIGIFKIVIVMLFHILSK